MENELVQWMPANPVFAFLISVVLNIAIAISGVLPSALITTANVTFFGFKTGLLVSIIGEAAGAIVSFVLYRHSLNKFHVQLKNRFLKKLRNTKGIEAVILVVILRFLPFIPSGVVTLTAAFGQTLSGFINQMAAWYFSFYYWQLYMLQALEEK
ncbi:VTT domain-containing protein [Pseudobacillus badius]|uniref:VTT domain-containing protein n=1 Tax=Bacillus badius TaxID=1455 RepID=UPI003D3340A1